MPIALTPPVAIHQSVSTPRPDDRHRQPVHRVRSEYLEMPGSCLTFDQACRLWALDSTTCGRVLQDPIAQGLVVVSDRGAYLRRTTT